MAMIVCSECNKAISDKAKICPNCGAPIEIIQQDLPIGNNMNQSIKEIFEGLLVLALIILGLWFWLSDSDEDIKKEAYSVKNGDITSLFTPAQKIKEISEAIALDGNFTSKRLAECLGYYAYIKDSDMNISNTISFCNQDKKLQPNKSYPNFPAVFENFSVLDGSYVPLIDKIKEQMNDPDSFEHEKTMYRIIDNDKPHLYVDTVFRGKNAFGGVVSSEATAKIDIATNEIYDFKIR